MFQAICCLCRALYDEIGGQAAALRSSYATSDYRMVLIASDLTNKLPTGSDDAKTGRQLQLVQRLMRRKRTLHEVNTCQDSKRSACQYHCSRVSGKNERVCHEIFDLAIFRICTSFYADPAL